MLRVENDAGNLPVNPNLDVAGERLDAVSEKVQGLMHRFGLELEGQAERPLPRCIARARVALGVVEREQSVAKIAQRELGPVNAPKQWVLQHETAHPILLIAKYLFEGIKHKIEMFFSKEKLKQQARLNFLAHSLKSQGLLNELQYQELSLAIENGGNSLKRELRKVIREAKSQDVILEEDVTLQWYIAVGRKDEIAEKALRYLLAASTFYHLRDNEDKLREVLTDREFRDIRSDLNAAVFDDETIDEFININARLTLFEWSEGLPADERKLFQKELRKNDFKVFQDVITPVLLAAADKIQDENPLKACVYRELVRSFKDEVYSDSYVQMAENIQTQQQLHKWSDELGLLELQLDLLTRSLPAHEAGLTPEEMGRANEVLNELMALYRVYGRVLKNDRDFLGSRSQFGAEMGQLRQQWQHVGDLMHELIPEEVSDHTFCNCIHDHAITGHKDPVEPHEFWPGTEPMVKKSDGIASAQIKGSDYIPGHEEQGPHDEKKKTAMFLSCNWGGGHTSCVDALQKYLGKKEFHTVNVDVPNQILLPTDPVNQLCGGEFTISTMFNTLLAGLNWRTISFLRGSKKKAPDPAAIETYKSYISERVLKERPNVLVSVYGMHNKYFRDVAKELGIPFMVIGTDMECNSEWLDGNDYEHVRMALPYDIQEQRDAFKGKIDDDKVVDVGYGIRPGFLQKRSEDEKDAIRSKYGICSEEKVVLVTNGSSGAESPWTKMICEAKEGDLPERVRVITICGRNANQKKKLEEYRENNRDHFNPNVTFEVRGFVGEEEMIDLQAITDVCVGKPGGSFVAESLVSDTQFLADNTYHLILWEAYTAKILQENRLGDVIKSKKEFLPKLREQFTVEKNEDWKWRRNDSEGAFYEALTDLIADAEDDDSLMARRDAWYGLNDDFDSHEFSIEA